MKFQRQLREDDCYRTCLAILLEIDAEDVPNFYEDSLNPDDDRWGHGEATEEWIDNWLLKRGLHRIKIYTAYGGPVERAQQVALEYGHKCSRELPYLLSGVSRNGYNHAVVCVRNEVVCDPSPKGISVVRPFQTGLFMYEWIVRLP